MSKNFISIITIIFIVLFAFGLQYLNQENADQPTGTAVFTGSKLPVYVPRDIIAWWPGDGNANDIIGNSEGALMGGATATVSGKVSQAFNLDGVNDFVDIENRPELNPTSVTLDAWVYPTASTSVMRPVVGKYDQTAPSGIFGSYLLSYGVYPLETGTQRFFGWVQTSDGVAGINSVGTLELNAWNFIAMTYNATTGNLRLYLNGVLDSELTHSGSILTTTFPVRIGTVNNPDTGYFGFFNGRIDEVEIFNRDLSSKEIPSIYKAGSAGKNKQGPVITTLNLPEAGVGSPYSTVLSITGIPPYTCGLVLGSLPAGLTLSASACTISGTPSATGTSTFILKATDSAGRIGSKSYTLSVRSCSSVPSDLVSWWRSESATSFVSSDSIGGNNLNLPLSGVSVIPAKVVNGLEKSGSVTMFAYNADSLRPTSGITIDAWFKANTDLISYTGKRYLVFKDYGSWCGGSPYGCSTTYPSYALYIDTSTDALYFGILGEGSAATAGPSAVTLSPGAGASLWNDGNFHHVAGTYDGAYVRLFVDGTEVGFGTALTGNIYYDLAGNQGQLRVGNGFFGVLDEIDLFNRALSASEINSIWYAGSLGKCL